MADASCGLVKHLNGGFGLVASWGVLRGEAARAEGVAGARPSLPRSEGARGRPRCHRLGPWPSYAGRSGRAAVRSEVKKAVAGSSVAAPRLEMGHSPRARGSAWGTLWEARGLEGTKAGRGGGASRVRLHLADRAGWRRTEGQAVEG